MSPTELTAIKPRASGAPLRGRMTLPPAPLREGGEGAVGAAAETRSTCPYCGVGCGVIIETAAGEITGVRGDPDHPANFGRLCSKGRTLHLTATRAVTMQTRLLRPQLRSERNAPPQAIAWDAALDLAAPVAGPCAGSGAAGDRSVDVQAPQAR